MPEGTLGVAIDLHRIASQHRPYMATTIAGRDVVHGTHIQHLRTFVVGYPKPLKAVLGKTFTGLAAYRRMGRRHEGIAVVPDGTAAVAGNPHKAAAVDKDVVDIVVGQARTEVEARHIVLAHHLSPAGNILHNQQQGYEEPFLRPER